MNDVYMAAIPCESVANTGNIQHYKPRERISQLLSSVALGNEREAHVIYACVAEKAKCIKQTGLMLRIIIQH